MIKTFSLILLALCSLQATAQEQTVTDTAGTGFNPAIVVDLVVQPSSGGAITTFDIFETSSNGLTEATAPNIYVPLRTESATASEQNAQYSFFSDRNTLPRIDNRQPVEHAATLRFRLNVNISTFLTRLHVAIKGENTSGYRVMNDYGEIAADTSLRLQDVDLTDICAMTDEIDCDALDKDVAPTGTPQQVTLHFFLAQNEISRGTSHTPQANNGVFYTINFSTRVFADRIIDLFDVQKGDSQLIADYRGFIMDDIRSLFGIIEPPTAGICATPGLIDSTNNDDTMLSLGKSFSDLTDLESVIESGQEKFEDLANGNCYEVRLIQCDLYGFCSFASQSFQQSPEEIEALLKKQACFFFTAGFGRQHFIVDYFQKWRNQVLKKFWLGRAFISWYYKTAPQYTPYILKTPWLQKTIQFIAYVLYGVIKGWWVLALFVVFGVVQLARKKRRASSSTF